MFGLFYYKTRQTGLTLIELMIVIAVMGVLLAVGLPSFNDMIDRTRLKGATEKLYSNLHRARSESIKRNDEVFVNFSADGTATWSYGISTLTGCTVAQTDPANAAACTLVVDDGDGTVHDIGGAVDTDDKVLMRYTSAEHTNVLMTLAGFDSGTQLAFDGRRGTSIGNTGRIELESGLGKKLQVRLAALGQVRICTPDASVPGYVGC